MGKEEPAYAVVFYLDDKVMPYSEVSTMPETGYVMLREANKERFEEEMSAYRCVKWRAPTMSLRHLKATCCCISMTNDKKYRTAVVVPATGISPTMRKFRCGNASMCSAVTT